MLGLTRTISLLVVGLLILESRTCSGLGDPDDTEWWETTLVYQIWPRSYQDSDGDGEGDIQGIISRLDYIEALGVETICLNPIYPSPLMDSGYDVTDYKNVHPTFGNLTDFDQLIEDAHERDIKIILDFVPNHTSDEHEWFNASMYSVDPYTDYYVWANGTLTEDYTMLPPNNWISDWGNEENSAWKWNAQRDQWYYHKFHESEPDLNLDNLHVRDEIMLILEFWLNRGVDGFRISGVPYLFEDPHLRDEPSPLNPKYTFGLEKNIQFLYDIRSVVDHWTKSNNSTSKYLIADSYDTDNNLLSYYGNNEKLGILPFNYRFIMDISKGRFNATEIEKNIEEWLALIPSNASTNWAISNDDNWRITSRVGSDKLDALQMLSMLLPGQAYTYYGDEIGMIDTPIRWILPNDSEESISIFQTPESHNDEFGYSAKTPMQWNDTISAGFSTIFTTYLPVNDDYVDTNVENQIHDPQSHLNIYKRLAVLRKNPVFAHGDLEIASLNDHNVLLLRRTLTDHPVYLVVINFADNVETIEINKLYPDLDEYLDIVVTSGSDKSGRTTVNRNNFDLLPNTGIVLRSGGNDESNETKLHFDNEKIEEKDEKADEETNEMGTTTEYRNFITEDPNFITEESNSTTENLKLANEDITPTSEKIETSTASYASHPKSTIDSTPEMLISMTTEMPRVESIISDSTTPSDSASGALNANIILQIAIIFATIIFTRG